MQVIVDHKLYNTIYFPFYRISKRETYDLFGIRYPSGRIEKLIVVDKDNYMFELKNYLEFLIREYLLEDDMILTADARKLKEDIRGLFS